MCLGFAVCRMIFIFRFLLFEEGSGFFEFGFGVAGSQKAVVADFDEACGQHVEEEAPDKLLGGEGHLPGIFGGLIIPGLEGHVAVLAVDQTVIGNGHAVSIAAEVSIDMLGAVERFFGVDHPFLPSEFLEETIKS